MPTTTARSSIHTPASQGSSGLLGFQGCPVLGVGLGLRRELLKPTLAATDLIHWLEVIPENYMGREGLAQTHLQQAQERFPLISHGVNLSIAGPDPLDEVYLNDLQALFERIHPPWFSDHLCMTRMNGRYINDLIPVPRTKATVRYIADRIRQVQDRFQRPFLVENISYYLEYDQNTLPDADFLAAVSEAADCGILLDVNNIVVNAHNHGWNAHQYLDSLPLGRVVQLHVAGHQANSSIWVDTHGEAVCQAVWALVEEVLQRCQPCGILLERDSNFPEFEALQAELTQLQAVWRQYVHNPAPTTATETTLEASEA
ncbi:MAG: DUF692 domain-containing protein [Candidatus Melainabacteria bacterium]|nr:DUF692 domain-containing protein [Candidatus Melainabacteria bacterium]